MIYKVGMNRASHQSRIMSGILQLTAALLLACLVSGALVERDWWENGNFYQIYPRSFKDSDGDGIGDLNGIAEKLPYLRDLGIDGVWLSPIFKSPMSDFGYDISDYYQVQPEYGTVEDLVNLQNTAHALGLRLILDFVPNHTSDEHEWFQRSVNRDPLYEAFYIWHDGVLNATTGLRQPPSNWLSAFRGSAWEWNDQRQQYYLHQFGIKQPDLNYRNPAVKQALKDILTYWLDNGIDGFRIDAVPYFYEVEIDPATGTYPDEPVIGGTESCPDPQDFCYLDHIYTASLPESITTIYEWRELVDDWKRAHNSDTKLLLSEAYTSFKNLMLLYGDGERNGSHVPFNFEMLSNLNSHSTAADYLYYVQHWLKNMPKGVYANWVLGNHDNGRLASRFGVERTDLMNILLQTLPGIAVTYNGEELGMEDVWVTWEETVDPQGCSQTPETYYSFSRDPARTPFRWDNSTSAGFSTSTSTWLPVGTGYEQNNVEAQLAAGKSHLQIFKRVVSLRRQEQAFQLGGFEPRIVDDVLIYRRQADTGDAFIVVLNIGKRDTVVDLSSLYDNVGSYVQVVTSSLQSDVSDGSTVTSKSFVASAYNGYVLRIGSNQ